MTPPAMLDHEHDEDVPGPIPHGANAESCTIGALLHQPNADRAAAVLAQLTDADFDDPRARLALGLIRMVVAAGHAPDPMLAAAAAERDGLHDGPDTLHALSVYLIDVHQAVPHPGSLAAYAHEVLKQSFRRQAARFGMQVQQYAENGSEKDLFHVLRTGLATLRELHARPDLLAANTRQGRHG